MIVLRQAQDDREWWSIGVMERMSYFDSAQYDSVLWKIVKREIEVLTSPLPSPYKGEGDKGTELHQSVWSEEGQLCEKLEF